MTNFNKKSELFLNKLNELNDISGFLNVSKIKSDTIKGFSWIYRYNENGKRKQLTSVHLCILKYHVLSNNLDWQIIDRNCANKSIRLEKSNYHLYDYGSGILFLEIINNNSIFNGFWRYKFEDIEIVDIDFNKIEIKVKNYNLPWIILNQDNANKSKNLYLDSNFKSGIYMVTKTKHDIYHTLFQWAYIYENSNGGYDFLKNYDLNLLKKEVTENNFSWIIVDENKYKESIKDNEINLEKIEHFKWSYTGFYKVKKRAYDGILQGFLWIYRYKKNYKQIELSSTNLLELKEKVLKNKLDWFVVDENKANESLNENFMNSKKYGFNTNKNKTGLYRVYKSKNNSSKIGFHWVYNYTKNKKRKHLSSFDLNELRKKVLSNELKWEIIDDDLAKKSFEENERNIKKFYKN